MELNTLLDKYQTLFTGNLARIKCFTQMILGLIISGNVQQHKCSLGFKGEALQESTCRRIRRFLAKFSFGKVEMAKALVSMMGLSGPMGLSLDRTNWKFGILDINLLVLAVVVNPQFAFPLFWVALPKAGNSNFKERIDLLQIFIKTFGSKKILFFTGDREFIGKKWIDFLMKEKIPFFIRIKENRLINNGETKKHLTLFFKHLKIGEKRVLECELDGYRLYLAGTRSSEGELVIVMSNQDKREKILSIYKNRWTIERLFFNCKTNGFNLEDTHLKDLFRIENLMAVVASAMVLSFLVGENQERKRPTPYKKMAKSPAYSTFRRGFDFIRQFLIKSFQAALNFLSLLLSENFRCFSSDYV